MLEKDREKYLLKQQWMFKPHMDALEKNRALQSETDNKLYNMINGTKTAALLFTPSDPMSKFIFNCSTPVEEGLTRRFTAIRILCRLPRNKS
jgi:hypothetical protein